MKKTSTILILLAFCLAGCAAQNTTTSAPTAAPTSTMVPATATLTTTAGLPPNNAQRYPPTSTPPDGVLIANGLISLEDLHATQTARPSVTPVISPTITPTHPASYELDCAHRAVESSPDGQWEVVYCNDFVGVVSLDRTRLWKIQFLNDEGILSANCESGSDFTVLHWTAGDDFMYYSEAPHADGGCCSIFNGGFFYRINLLTGEVDHIFGEGDFIPFKMPRTLSYLAWTPDDQYMIIVSDPIQVIHMATGIKEEYSLPEGSDLITDFMFTPDGNQFILLITNETNCEIENQMLVLYDPAEGFVRTLATGWSPQSDNDHYFGINFLRWEDSDHFKVETADHQVLTIDLNSNITLMPTPRP